MARTRRIRSRAGRLTRHLAECRAPLLAVPPAPATIIRAERRDDVQNRLNELRNGAAARLAHAIPVRILSFLTKRFLPFLRRRCRTAHNARASRGYFRFLSVVSAVLGNRRRTKIVAAQTGGGSGFAAFVGTRLASTGQSVAARSTALPVQQLRPGEAARHRLRLPKQPQVPG